MKNNIIKKEKTYKEFKKFVLEFKDAVIGWATENPIEARNFQNFTEEMMKKYNNKKAPDKNSKKQKDNSISGDSYNISIENNF